MSSVGSISVALKNAVSGLQATQSSLQTVSNNIANVNTEGYSRKIVELQTRAIDGTSAGVEVANVSRVVDEFLLTEIRTNLSSLGNFQELKNYFGRMQSMFGTLNDDASVSRTINGLLTALEDLSITPEGLSQQLNVINQASDFTRQINKMTQDLQDLRLRADREISDSVTTINTQSAIVHSLNFNIARNLASGQSTADLEDRRDIAVDKIAKEIGISTFKRSTGEMVIMTTAGDLLVDREARTLTHASAASMSAVILPQSGGV
ncbi:MAG: flagellar hook-associated protein FlgK [Rhodospirillaceae bacterium]|jgi:flagellar hook-associated protein 1|nr:flagellar hook-associated protein FlgK [Rhodospirillaceae bacterium]MBT5752042.1 flagellar hook-associated protein FlgK [Rhodospirillaceae bacterium]